jgi:hypothetical protein
VKKAIASKSADIHIRTNPNRGITAPISKISPAVPNKPTLDLFETCFRERQMKKAAIIAKTQTITKITNIPAINGNIAEGSMLLVSGVIP